MNWMSPDFFFDHACLFPQFPGDQREIDLVHGRARRTVSKVPVRNVILRCNETAACFLIKPVNNTRPFFSADTRQCRAMVQQRVDQSVFGVSRSGMHRHAGRFVDDDQVVVFEKNLEWNRLRSGLDFFERRLG